MSKITSKTKGCENNKMKNKILKTTLLTTLATIQISLCMAAQNEKPNIIYIYTDDWGIGKVPCYGMDPQGQAIIETPNLDRLRNAGMLFTDAYAANAVCGPSRNSLLTGRHPGNSLWRANRKSMKGWPPKHPALGKVAQMAGYKTAGFGKLSYGGSSTPEGITNVGWDYWLGFLDHINCRDYYSPYIWENGEKIMLPENDPERLNPKGPVLGEDGKFLEDMYADKAIEFIRQNTRANTPFFIYYASTVPHGGKPGGMRVPSLEGYDKKNLTELEQLYCALMTHHDQNVGRIMDELKVLGIEKNTLLIWTSDNGDTDSYYKKTTTFDGNGPFRMYKRYLYEGGIRVPMLAMWPGHIQPGSTSGLITAQWDLLPTIADAGNLPRTKYMDGISILPTLSGEPQKQESRKYLYWEFYEKGRQQAVRMGKWKAYRLGGRDSKTELYDIEKDIAETNNLAVSHPEIIQQMEAIMEKEHGFHPSYNPHASPPKKKKTQSVKK